MKKMSHVSWEHFTRGFFKVFYTAAFLFISIFFVLPYLVQISTYSHEKAHQKALDSYYVENSYYVNLIETIPRFWNPKTKKLGVTRFDIQTYEKLSHLQKADINLAGLFLICGFYFLLQCILHLQMCILFTKLDIKENMI